MGCALTVASAAQDDASAAGGPRGLVLHEEGAFEGFTLFTPLRTTDAVLVDMKGETVHRWETDYPPGGGIYLLETGNLLRLARVEEGTRFNGGGIGGRVQELDWDGNVVWDWLIADEFQQSHHDLEPLPNGNVLVIVWEHRFQEDALAVGRDAGTVGEAGLWPDAILEVRPVRPDDAEIVWEWHAWDHVIQDRDPDLDRYGSIPDEAHRIDINADHRDEPPMTEEERARLEEMEEQMRALGYVGDDSEDEADGAAAGLLSGESPDWMHTNAVAYHPGLDLIALSSPEMNEIWIIDHSLSSEDAAYDDGGRWGQGGGILYRWGNPKNYGAGDAGDRRFFYQHDVTFVDSPEGEDDLRVLVYNNGGGRPGGDFSSVEELVLPFDRERGFVRAPGEPFGPKEPAWSYSDPGNFFSGFISGAQRLPNGNTLICEGASGRLIEVTREGRVVWEFLNPFLGEAPIGSGGNAPPTALFRATRLAPDHPGLSGRL